MALPSSGQISISQIRTELQVTNGSLSYLSTTAGKAATPNAMSEFYGYTLPVAGIPLNWSVSNYIGSATGYYGVANMLIQVNGVIKVNVNVTNFNASGVITVPIGATITITFSGDSGIINENQLLVQRVRNGTMATLNNSYDISTNTVNYYATPVPTGTTQYYVNGYLDEYLGGQQ